MAAEGRPSSPRAWACPPPPPPPTDSRGSRCPSGTTTQQLPALVLSGKFHPACRFRIRSRKRRPGGGGNVRTPPQHQDSCVRHMPPLPWPFATTVLDGGWPVAPANQAMRSTSQLTPTSHEARISPRTDVLQPLPWRPYQTVVPVPIRRPLGRIMRQDRHQGTLHYPRTVIVAVVKP